MHTRAQEVNIHHHRVWWCVVVVRVHVPFGTASQLWPCDILKKCVELQKNKNKLPLKPVTEVLPVPTGRGCFSHRRFAHRGRSTSKKAIGWICRKRKNMVPCSIRHSALGKQYSKAIRFFFVSLTLTRLSHDRTYSFVFGTFFATILDWRWFAPG